MAQKYPGLYIYYDWMDALEKMSPDKAMAILKNLRYYSEKNRDPMPVGGAEEMIQSFMLAQIKRSKTISNSCKKYKQHEAEVERLLASGVAPNDIDLSLLPPDVRRIQEVIRQTRSR